MITLISDPKNLVIIIRSKSFEAECTREDPWYGTKFSKEKFTESLFDLMRNPKLPEGCVGMPPVNTLLPENLDIVAADSVNSSVPTLIKEWPGDTEVWFLKDDKFQRPKAFVSLKVYPHTGFLQEHGKSANGKVLADEWVQCIKEYLREFIYMASMASLEVEISTVSEFVVIKFSGFNDSMPASVSQALNLISEFSNVKEEQLKPIFNQVKEKLMQEWHNAYYEQSYSQATSVFETIILSPSYEKRSLRAILEGLTYEQFAENLHRAPWVKSGRFVWFLHGNFSLATALEVTEKARSILPATD